MVLAVYPCPDIFSMVRLQMQEDTYVKMNGEAKDWLEGKGTTFKEINKSSSAAVGGCREGPSA